MTCFHFFNICIHISICTYKHSYVLMYIQFRNTELRNGAARKPSLSFGPSNQHPAHPLGVVVFVVAATATVTANNIAYSLQRATAREWGERKKKKSEPTRALIVRLSKTRARPPYGSPCCCCPTSESKTHARPPRVVQVQDNSECEASRHGTHNDNVASVRVQSNSSSANALPASTLQLALQANFFYDCVCVCKV